MPNEEYLTTAEAAKLLKVSTSTVRLLARDGRLPAIRVGVQWRIPHEAPELWLYKQKQAQLRGKSGPSQKPASKKQRSGFEEILKIAAAVRVK